MHQGAGQEDGDENAGASKANTKRPFNAIFSSSATTASALALAQPPFLLFLTFIVTLDFHGMLFGLLLVFTPFFMARAASVAINSTVVCSAGQCIRGFTNATSA